MRRITQALCYLVILARPLSAQGHWSATLERGFTSFSAAAHDTSSPPVRVTPWHPAVYTLRVRRESGRLGIAIGVAYSRGELAGSVEDLVVLPGARITLLEFAPELTFRLATTAVGAKVDTHVGPVVDLWQPAGDDVRSAYGGMVGSTLTVPFAERWEVAIRADLAVTGSEVSKAEESDQVIRPATMRRGRLAFGITRTF